MGHYQILPAQLFQSHRLPACRRCWNHSASAQRRRCSQPRTWSQKNTATPSLNTMRRQSSSADLQCFLKMFEMLATVAYLQHLTTWKKGNFLVVWMEKEEWGAERLTCSLCCLTTSGNSSLISGLYSLGRAGFLNATQNVAKQNMVSLCLVQNREKRQKSKWAWGWTSVQLSREGSAKHL